jgi:hypothetical protein
MGKLHAIVYDSAWRSRDGRRKRNGPDRGDPPDAGREKGLECRMSNSVKTLLAVSLVAFVAACAAKEEVVYAEPEPVMAEPTYSKY